MLLKIDDTVWKEFVRAVAGVQDEYRRPGPADDLKNKPQRFSELGDSHSATAVLRKTIVGGHDAVFFENAITQFLTESVVNARAELRAKTAA